MKKYLTEFIGTFAFVFCGTGVNNTGYIFGNISGTHINPSATIAVHRNIKKQVESFIYPSFLSIISCTVSGFSSVDVSPMFSVSFEAIFRSILRIILPDRVLGKLFVN